MHMIQSGAFADKQVLIIDKDDKSRNDRTWSFWETQPGLFDSIVYRKWTRTWFHDEGFSRLLDLDPYTYKMIRGIDFYEYCLSIIRQQSNFTIRKVAVSAVGNENNMAYVQLNDEKVFGERLFCSILFDKPRMGRKEYFLRQHFKGWIIETKHPAFDPSEATLMDFRTSQQEGTTFVYVKPFSNTKALVEYTLFTEKLLTKEQYENGLRDYIARFITREPYSILEEENGIIPMTNHRFPMTDGRITYTGTAGGQTKASSGYTFQFIQKQSAALVKSLVETGHPNNALSLKKRYRFYDSVLLYILQQKKLPGHIIFSRLFKKNAPAKVLRFLDNESSLSEEIGIISSLPTWPFLKAALKQV
jgi:lycopene beta-cyclase